MNKQKLISVLQSRVAKRRMHLASYWELFEELVAEDSGDSEAFKMHLLRLGDEQKEDKQILKQLVKDERGHKLQALYYKNLSDYTKQVERKLASYTMTAKPYLEG